GGPGSFVIPIKERDKVKEAARQKLILGGAGVKPAAPGGGVAAGKPRISCPHRGRPWGERWGRGVGFRWSAATDAASSSAQADDPVHTGTAGGAGLPAFAGNDVDVCLA